MRPSPLTRAVGLILTGFLAGVIIMSLSRNTAAPRGSTADDAAGAVYRELAPEYEWIARTGVWDVLVEKSPEGRSIALGQRSPEQGAHIRVVVRDDWSALYVMTFKSGDPVWQGRLMDVGNDGTVEVADLSYGHCEAFSPP